MRGSVVRSGSVAPVGVGRPLYGSDLNGIDEKRRRSFNFGISARSHIRSAERRMRGELEHGPRMIRSTMVAGPVGGMGSDPFFLTPFLPASGNRQRARKVASDCARRHPGASGGSTIKTLPAKIIAAVAMSTLISSCEPNGPAIYCRELGHTFAREDLWKMARCTGDCFDAEGRSPAASLCLARAGEKPFELFGARAAYNLSLRADARSSEYRQESCRILRRCSAYDQDCAYELRSAACPA